MIVIDPGKNGAIVKCTMIEGPLQRQWKYEAHRMPKTECDIVELIKSLRGEDEVEQCYIEKVSAMPGNGVTSMFSFGRNYGLLRGAIIASGYVLNEVTPKSWQKNIVPANLEKAERKNAIKQYVQQRLPGEKVTLYTADALAMAIVLTRSE